MASPRFKLLEAFALRAQTAFAGSGRLLNLRERGIALAVFGQALDLDAIRIAEAGIVNAPTVLGNTIRVRPGEPMTHSTLVHELVHVWQFQKQGPGYISDSVWHQGKAILEEGTRSAAYEFTLKPNCSIHDYTAEQQASIVEQAYADPTGFGARPEVLAMLAEIYEPSS